MDNNEKKIKAIKEGIEWAETEMEKPEYKDDPESLAFFKGVIFLKKYLED